MNVFSVVTLYLLTCQVTPAPYGSIGDQPPALGRTTSPPPNYQNNGPASSSRAGNATATGLPSSLPVQPMGSSNASPQSVVPEEGHITSLTPQQTFGWDRDRDGKLYYIIQISPDHAKIMVSEYERNIAETIEQASTMPVELVGHVSRIAVRVGTKILPRNPSLDVIRSWGPVAKNDIERTLAGLGSGRLAEVEQPAMPVGQQPLPREGTFPRPSTGGNSSSLGDQFLSDTRPPYGQGNSQTGQTGGTGQGFSGGRTDPSLPDRLPSLGANGTSGMLGDRSNTESSSLPDYNGSPYGSQTRPNGLTPDPPSFGMSPQAPNLANDRYSGQVASQTQPGQNQLSGNQQRAPRQNSYDAYQGGNAGQPNALRPGAGSLGATSNQYDSYQYDTGPAARLANNNIRPNNSGGYGAGNNYGGQNGSSPPANPYSANQYAGNQANGIPANLASQAGTAGNQTVASNTANPTSPSNTNPPSSDLKQADSNDETQRTDNTSLISLFCLLSLAVNGYLFMLIRKLLTRYRTLLTNVRSQAA